MVVVDRHLTDGPGKRDGQLAARADVAEQHVRERVAGLDAEKPGLDDRGHVVGGPLDRERAAVHEHQDDWSAGRLHRLEQLLLDARQTQARAAGGLAAHVPRFPEHEQRHVGEARERDRLRDTGRGCVGDTASLGVEQLRVRSEAPLDPFEHGHGIPGIAPAGPRAERRDLVVRERADHGERPDGRAQGEALAVVLEQDDRLLRHPARELPVLGREQHRPFALHARAVVRIGEQPERSLCCQNAAHGGVHGRDRDAPRPDQGGHVLEIDPAHHVHVDASIEPELPCVGPRARDAVGQQLFDARPIAHDESPKLPLVAEQRRHEPAVRVARDAGDLVEGGHDAAGARVHRRPERRQVDLPQRALRHVHRVVVPPTFGAAVCREVLDGGHHRLRRAQVGPLEAAHSRRRHLRSQVGILPGALRDSAPARIASDVHHRREGPVHARRGGLAGRHMRGGLDGLGVP